MDVWLLGAAAIVLIGITLWIVWPTRASEAAASGSGAGQETSEIPPQGNRFEDQYTSATADLSAGGVALAEASEAVSLEASEQSAVTAVASQFTREPRASPPMYEYTEFVTRPTSLASAEPSKPRFPSV